MRRRLVTCPACDGTGRLLGSGCRACAGRGYDPVPGAEVIDLTAPIEYDGEMHEISDAHICVNPDGTITPFRSGRDGRPD